MNKLKDHSFSNSPLFICETAETTNTEHNYSIKVSSEIRNMHADFIKALKTFIETPKDSVAREASDKLIGHYRITA